MFTDTTALPAMKNEKNEKSNKTISIMSNTAVKHNSNDKRPNGLTISVSLLQAVNHSGDGSATRVLLLHSARSSASTAHRRELQLLQVVLDGVDPSFLLSTSVPLSIDICLQDSLGTVVVFSPMHVSVPSQPGLAYIVRNTGYFSDTTNIITFQISSYPMGL